MNEIKMKTCRRCRGTGLVSSPVVYCGVPGGCYTCALVGQVPVDKFYREVGTKGTFFGISLPIKAYAFRTDEGKVIKVLKEIRRAKSADSIMKDSEAGTVVTEITEEQARAFWTKYGLYTEVAA